MTSPSQPAPQPTSSISLPQGLSPESIDTLPVLSAILSRMQNVSPTFNNTAGSPPAASPPQLANGSSPLTFKDIHTETDDLKHKLQKARLQTQELPDIERSISEQDEEIIELEERIAKQREVLDGLRELKQRIIFVGGSCSCAYADFHTRDMPPCGVLTTVEGSDSGRRFEEAIRRFEESWDTWQQSIGYDLNSFRRTS